MSDSTEILKSPGPAHRADELLTTIRDALAQDASVDVRSAGVLACRAILGALDPAARANASAVPSASPITPPSPGSSIIGSLLAAIGTIPREQLVDALGGLRWLFGNQGPTYLSRPSPLLPPDRGH